MRVRFVVLVAVLFGAASSTPAQEPAPAQASAPLPASSPQPVTAFFRRLLAASEAEQRKLLEQKAEKTRHILVEKLEEYKGLEPTERQRRLRLLDLRWYITQLRSLAPSNRLERLAAIPEADRKIVEERLAIYDALTASQKRQVWLYDPTRNYLVSPPQLPPSPPGLIVTSSQPPELEEAVERWRGLPVEKQQEIVQHFQSIFEDEPTPPLPSGLTPDQQRTFSTLTRLEPSEREKCVEGFQKFVALSPPEREQFMNKLNRWNKMSLEERNAWRMLLPHMPPSPPGLRVPAATITPPTAPPTRR